MELKLPIGIVTKSDLLRIESELLRLQEAFRQAALLKRPLSLSPSPLIEQLFADHHLQLNEAADRTALLGEIARLKRTAPVVHVSLASEPNTVFLSKLVRWFRDTVHGQTLLQISLRPAMAAGIVVRTTNKVFDGSLRSRLDANKHVLQAGVKSVDGSR